MKRKKPINNKPLGLIEALKDLAGQVPTSMSRMSEKEIVEWVKTARREIRKEKLGERTRRR